VLAQSARYEGRNTQETTTEVPMGYLAKNQGDGLVVQKVGKGRLYYRLGLRYAPKSLALEAANHGVDQGRTGVAAMTRDLADGNFAAFCIEDGDVSEGATDVYPNPN